MSTKQQPDTDTEEGADTSWWDDSEENVDDLLGALAPALSWPEIGTTVTGVVTSMTRGIQTEPDGTIKTWQDGKPRAQAILTLQTSLAEDDDDDGQRRLFIKGAMVGGFRAAMRKAHVKGPRPGGVLTVTYAADAKPKVKGHSPTKLFTVDYTPPGA